MNLLFITGPVCSGKTSYIYNTYGWAGLPVISMGGIAKFIASRKNKPLNELIDKETFLCSAEDDMREHLYSVIREFNLLNHTQSIIIDGFPRSPEQFEWLLDNLAIKHDIKIVHLIADKAELARRMSDRGRADDSLARLEVELARFSKLSSVIGEDNPKFYSILNTTI